MGEIVPSPPQKKIASNYWTPEQHTTNLPKSKL